VRRGHAQGGALGAVRVEDGVVEVEEDDPGRGQDRGYFAR